MFRYSADSASVLTDLGHAYVLLGLPLYGKKVDAYIDLNPDKDEACSLPVLVQI